MLTRDPLFFFLLIIAFVVPGTIANSKKLPNTGYIWLLAFLGLFTGSATWLVAMFWAGWPKQAAAVWVEVLKYVKPWLAKLKKSDDPIAELDELDALLAAGRITKAEYAKLRAKKLGLD
jgi:hypothetical protein